MRSNPQCPVCNSIARAQIDQMMYNGTSSQHVLNALMKQVNKKLKEYDDFNDEYLKKRSEEMLSDDDIAARNKIIKELDEQKRIAELSYDELEHHRVKHATFKPNQCFKQPDLDPNDVLEGVNLSQISPNTVIGEGVEGLVFKNCNLTNCNANGIVVGGNKSQVSFCSHLHKEWVFEESCKKICEHVTSHVKELVIDGACVAKDIINYQDKVIN